MTTDSPPTPVQDIPDVPQHLSFSQYSMYERCSLQYKFRYIDGLIDPPKLATGNGKAGHAAVEANSRHKIKTGEEMVLPEMLQRYSDHFDNAIDEIAPEDLKKTDEGVGQVKDQTVQVLKVYHGAYAPKILPAVVEYGFDVQLGDPKLYQFPLRIANGIIDLITAQEEIFDNKFPTQRRAKSQDEIDMSTQLDIYDMAYWFKFHRLPTALGMLTFIPPGKNGLTHPADVSVATRTPQLLTLDARKARWARTTHKLQTTDAKIRAGFFTPADDPQTCSWCGYRTRCQSSLVKDDFTALAIRQHKGGSI